MAKTSKVEVVLDYRFRVYRPWAADLLPFLLAAALVGGFALGGLSVLEKWWG